MSCADVALSTRTVAVERIDRRSKTFPRKRPTPCLSRPASASVSLPCRALGRADSRCTILRELRRERERRGRQHRDDVAGAPRPVADHRAGPAARHGSSRSKTTGAGPKCWPGELHGSHRQPRGRRSEDALGRRRRLWHRASRERLSAAGRGARGPCWRPPRPPPWNGERGRRPPSSSQAARS